MTHIRPLNELVPDEHDGMGVYSFMISPKRMNHLIGDLDSLYARKGLGLKVFVGEYKPLDKFNWGGFNPAYNRQSTKNNLYDCTRIQNLAALHGFAPRVYDIVTTIFRGKTVYAQITDYIEDEVTEDKGQSEFGEMRSVFERYGAGISQTGGVDSSPKNFVGGKFVDFQMFNLDDNVFKKYVTKRADDATDWGSKDYSYQNVNKLRINGQRDTERRAGVLGLNTPIYNGRTVLDIGCSTGSFCRLASDMGAKRIVGVDVGETPIAAAEISYYLGYFNCDFYVMNMWDQISDLEEVTGISSYDIVLFLSVHQQIGYDPERIKRLTKDYFFLEGHSADKEETYRPMLEKDFSLVDFKGRMKNNARPAFLCRR
jgi:hypothetical protein